MNTVNYLAFIFQTWDQDRKQPSVEEKGADWGFHIISVKCFYLTAVTVLDKRMSAQVFVVYYEIIFQTRALKLNQRCIVKWLKVAGLATITHRDSEGQCKEQCPVLALSVFYTSGRQTGDIPGCLLDMWSNLKPHKVCEFKQSFCLNYRCVQTFWGCKTVFLIHLTIRKHDLVISLKRPFSLLV